MDTSQYLSMFLEECMDNLQTLNEALLQLEQEPNNVDKLNEIFRVAHTIKGMAATMGYSNMAELTHKMEDVLSKFREGELKVTEKVVTTLFQCLDTLENMVNNISEDRGENIPIDELIKSLEGLHNSREELQKEVAASLLSESSNEKNEDSGLSLLNEYELNVVKQAQEKGYNTFDVVVTISPNTLLKSARAFLIFKNLEEQGEIIKSVPTTEELENEAFDLDIELTYITNSDKNKVMKELMGISEVDKVEITELKSMISPKEALHNTKLAEPSKNQVEKGNPSVIKSKGIEEKGTKEHKDVAVQKKSHQSVRVDLERLDKFMNMVSELVIHRTRLEQISTSYKMGELNETLEQVARTTFELQDLVMKIRMLPLDVVFNRFPRMIRDLSVELDKEMELIIEGQDTELDRTVIDEIGEPLIHLIRNAADHGVEAREKRIAQGKDPVGKIRLIAYQEGTKAVIKVEDDGSGINVRRVKEKAEKIGINTEGMSDNDIRNLIFMQGFSTNEEVTDISGRGVGMDVVKTKIASLGGTVDVMSEEGKGTSFIIRLPLTLQIIQALLVKVGTETMAISLGYIDRVIDFKPDMIKKTNQKEVMLYRGSVIPFTRVGKRMGMDENSGNYGKKYVVIVKVGEKTAGLLVDSLLGQQEIVIKPLGKTLHDLKEYIGATILGDGLVTLILDAAAML